LNKYLQRFAAVLVLSSIVYINYLTLSNSRNVFFMDDWGTPGELFYSYFNGGIDASDFLSQHNESRLVLFKAFNIILLKFGVYSTEVSVYIRILLAVLICCLLYATGKNEICKYRQYYLYLSILIVFIPTQAYAMLFGITLLGFIVPLCLLLSVLVLFSRKSSLFKIICIIILSLISTFTYANGMILWVLCNPFIFNLISDSKNHIRRIHSFAFTAIGFIIVLFYFHDYGHPHNHPTITSGFSDPLRLMHFFAILIWSPFSMGWNHYLFSSVLLSLLLLYLVFHYREFLLDLLRRKVKVSKFTYSMFVILLYGLISCSVISFGRCGFGLKAALAEHYPMYSMWIHIALIGLALSVKHKKIQSLGKSFISFYLVLYVISFEYGVRRIKENGKTFELAEVALLYSETIPSNPFLRVLHHNPNDGVLPKIQTFKKNNLINVLDSDLSLANPKEFDVVDGHFNYRSDNSNIFFNGYSYNTYDNLKFDHIVVFDYDSNKTLKPILAASFNKPTKSYSKLLGIDSHSLIGFDHAISSNHKFVDPIACGVDLKNMKICRIQNNIIYN
jgi:hypothetical protein